MTQISGGGAPNFAIGSRPARRYAQRSNSPTSGWADALSQIGNAFVQRHNEQKRKDAEAAQAAKRTDWSKQIGQGATVREIAKLDPSIINDSDYLGFLSKNKPEAAAETFEIADDPYGRGGIGQRSSTTGRIVDYQGPQAPEGPPETMVDKAGFHRYLGGDMHGQRVFPDVTVPEDEPKLSPAILAYEQAQERGHLEPGTTFEDYKNFGRTTNTFQTPPPVPERGYRNVFDDQGRFASQELIPGSAAARKIEEAQEQTEDRARTTAQRGSIVSQHADGIRRLMEESTFPVTGLFSVTSSIPGTAGHDISKRVETLQAIAGFDTLNRMRAESPTGGALGQVSERELTFLQSVIGSLELSQSKGQFLENLARVEAAFNEIVHGGGEPQAQAQPPEPTNPNAALASAFVGGAPQAPGVPTSGAVDPARIADYARMPKDALQRQVDTMAKRLAANPDAYPQEEIDAAKRAYDLKFPEG